MGTGSRLIAGVLVLLLHALLLHAPGHAAWLANGTTLNGTTLNGTTLNGTTLNGTTLNGTTLNGTTLNGTTLNETTLGANGGAHAAAPDIGTKYRRLTGVRIDPRTGQRMDIQIRGFHGDMVDALVSTPERGRHALALPMSELIGMQWSESHCAAPDQCRQVHYRLIDGERDASRSTMPAHAENRDVWLFELQQTSAVQPAESDWQSFCQPDRQQQTRGMFLDGQWRADGSWDPRGYTFACTNGVLAKCARNWGYKPWTQVTMPGGERVSLQPLHQACTRAARADYCGDGVSHTRNGTLIDLFDRHGFNVREPVEGFQAEAGFTTAGASWIARPRFAHGDEARGASVQPATCARPRQVLAGSQDDALIYVWSRPGTVAE